MRKTAMILAAAGVAMLGGTMASGPLVARERMTGQQELAKLLEGRVAGEPQDCVSTFPTRHLRVIDKTALVYDAGSTIYVNVPANPASLDEDDAMVVSQFGTHLCRQDVITTHDRYAGFQTGTIFLGDFVPYRKAG
jgi:hypothetical protein